MRILFLHPRFPGQFMNLLLQLSASKQNEIVFLAQNKRADLTIPNVRLIQVPTKELPKKTTASEKALFSNYYTGELFAQAMLELGKEGFYPEAVYDHPGWGCGMYIQDIFPAAARICYCEWFYTKHADFAFLSRGKPRSPAAFAANRQRNLCQLDALKDCDVAISPTHWQASQYPVETLYKFRIIHDGIDTDFFSPSDLDKKEDTSDSVVQGLNLSSLPEIVTYATRGLEPYRGFPQFYKSIPKILTDRPEAHIIIMANDEVRYSAKRQDGKGWGEAMRAEIPCDPERVHFLKFGSYLDYRKVLRASSVHVYLTVPFVLSWSLLEAMSCGCLVVGSDTPPVREVLHHAQNGFLTSFWDSDGMADMIVHVLQNRSKYDKIRLNARSDIENKYSVKKLFPQQLFLIQETILRKQLFMKAIQSSTKNEQTPVKM